jgi:hypothetical protein
MSANGKLTKREIGRPAMANNSSSSVRMKLALSVVSLAVVLNASVSWAQTKHTYAVVATSDANVGLVDTQSIASVGGNVTAWTLWVNAKDVKVGESFVAYSLSRDTYNCTDRTSASTMVVEYDIKGNSVDSSADYRPPRLVIPDSVGEILLDAVCGGADKITGPTYSDISEAVQGIKTYFAITTGKLKPKH